MDAVNPADPRVEVVGLVKPLVWAWSDTARANRADAMLTQNVYLVWRNGGAWHLSSRNVNGDFGTEGLAKAAAQADYTARIVAALDPTALDKLQADAVVGVPYLCRDGKYRAIVTPVSGDIHD